MIDTILIVAENVAIVVIVVIHEQVAGVSVVVVIVTESIEVLIIVGVVLVALAHRGIEAVLCNSDPLTKDRGLEGQWR